MDSIMARLSLRIHFLWRVSFADSMLFDFVLPLAFPFPFNHSLSVWSIFTHIIIVVRWLAHMRARVLDNNDLNYGIHAARSHSHPNDSSKFHLIYVEC